jgi:hypothetical protein
MSHVVIHAAHARRIKRSSALTLACCVSALVVSGCHRAADLTEQARSSTQPELSLRSTVGTDDTARVVVHLEQGVGTGIGTAVVGSFTGHIERTAKWRFVGCSAPQGHPLLACNDTEGSVKLAAAWVEGVTAGDLISVTFVSNPATAAASAPAGGAEWQLGVQEVHAVSGASLTDALEVRRDVRPAVVRAAVVRP